MTARYNYIFLTADKKYLELKVASVDNAVIHCKHSLQAGKTRKNVGIFRYVKDMNRIRGCERRLFNSLGSQ